MCKGLFVAGLVDANVSAMPTAGAAGQVWTGSIRFLRYAGEKTGARLAARQPEPDFSNIYTFVTDCTRGTCGSPPRGRRAQASRSDGLPLPPQYTWNGSTWVHIYDWQWDCYLGEGVPRAWNPARSVAYYTPQPDGTLRGSWRTDISGGPCDGSVIMDVAAFPAR